jgi:hypothetical protein
MNTKTFVIALFCFLLSLPAAFAATHETRITARHTLRLQAGRCMAAGTTPSLTLAVTPAKRTVTTSTGTTGIGNLPIATEFTNNSIKYVCSQVATET